MGSYCLHLCLLPWHPLPVDGDAEGLSDSGETSVSDSGIVVVVLVENVVGSTVFVPLAGLVALGTGVGADPPLSPSPPVESCAGVVVLGTDEVEVLTGTEDEEDAVGAGELPALSLRGLGPGTV